MLYLAGPFFISLGGVRTRPRYLSLSDNNTISLAHIKQLKLVFFSLILPWTSHNSSGRLARNMLNMSGLRTHPALFSLTVSLL